MFTQPRTRQKLTAKRMRTTQQMRLLTYFIQGQFTDVTVKTKDKEFQAHRLILASHSPVFEKIFTTDMQEAKTGIVHIENVRSEIIGIILRFMYSGVVEKLPELFCEIFTAADFYDIRELSQVVVTFMTNNINVDNATRILKLRHSLHSSECELAYNKALTFIRDNEHLMIKREEYLAHLVDSMNVGNVVKSLKLAKKYELAELKSTAIEYISKNFKEVQKLQEYRNMYRDKDWIDLIIEIDQYMAEVIEKKISTNGIEIDDKISDLVDKNCNIE